MEIKNVPALTISRCVELPQSYVPEALTKVACCAKGFFQHFPIPSLKRSEWTFIFLTGMLLTACAYKIYRQWNEIKTLRNDIKTRQNKLAEWAFTLKKTVDLVVGRMDYQDRKIALKEQEIERLKAEIVMKDSQILAPVSQKIHSLEEELAKKETEIQEYRDIASRSLSVADTAVESRENQPGPFLSDINTDLSDINTDMNTVD
jgi:predicted Holliday junction resolvase-like endonuclease